MAKRTDQIDILLERHQIGSAAAAAMAWLIHDLIDKTDEDTGHVEVRIGDRGIERLRQIHGLLTDIAEAASTS